jgi:hypothetical protein
MSNLIKILLVRAEFYADRDGRTYGQTDKHDESNSRFSQFFERAKNGNMS